MAETALVPVERIEQAILVIRGHKVLLDSDLAALYEVETKVLNQAVRRNPDRFPPDFAFRLSADEFAALRSQIVTSKGRGGRRYPPYAFTEHGVAMLSSVLNSPRAVQVNIEIMRTFIRLRQVLASNEELARKMDEVVAHLGKHDKQIAAIFDVMRQLLSSMDAASRRRIGFRPPPGKPTGEE